MPAAVWGRLAGTRRLQHVGKILGFNRARRGWDNSRSRQDWGCCQSLFIFLWGLWKERFTDDMSEQEGLCEEQDFVI